MLRSLFTLALSLFLLTESGAQTAPSTASKTKVKSAKATARATRRAAKKASKVAVKTAPAATDTWTSNDGWPPVDASQNAVASANGAEGYGAAPAASRGEIDNVNVYAAPGMPVHVRSSKEMAPYSVRPARKSAGGTTLNPGK